MIKPYFLSIPVSASAAEKISKKSVTLIKGQRTTLKVTGTKEKITWSSSKKREQRGSESRISIAYMIICIRMGIGM